MVVGTFSNGQNLDLAEVTLSHFNGTNYLQALSGEAYAVTEQSGPANCRRVGHDLGSSLEGSNTDIADEFTKLIVTQQAYSANTKVITTANDMVSGSPERAALIGASRRQYVIEGGSYTWV